MRRPKPSSSGGTLLRLSAVPVVLGVAVTLVACEPTPEMPCACSIALESAEPRPGVLLSVTASGPETATEAAVPVFELQEDGTVFVPGAGPTGVDSFRLTGVGVDEVARILEPVSLVQPEYEEATWTDLDTTTLYADLPGADVPREVAVDGLGQPDVDADVDDPDRDELVAALAELDALAEAARDGGDDPRFARTRSPYVPREVGVTLPTDAGTSGLPAGFGADDVGWSDRGLPCLAVRGDAVRRLPADLAATAQPALPHHSPACRDEAPARLGVGVFTRSRIDDAAAPDPLAVHAAAPLAEEALVEELAGTSAAEQLHSYDAIWLADGRDRVRVVGSLPRKYADDLPDAPPRWSVTVDVARDRVVDVASGT